MDAVAGRSGWPRDPDGSPLYPGLCKHLSKEEQQRRLSAGEPAALRIDMEAAIAKVGRHLDWREMGPGSQARDVTADPALWGDAILSRKDISASYHIAVVVDDAVQGVTDVVRGEDLFRRRACTACCGPARSSCSRLSPSRFCVMPGRKLSKSSRAKPIRALREEGFSPCRGATGFRWI
jgi:glutamyl-Q tRNA(Asp) synthetase